LAAQSTIVYADLADGSQQSPSAIASAIARAAEESQAAGQFDVALLPLSADDVRRAIDGYPSGHERLSLDRSLVLLDAGAMLAYAPYRARVVLTHDPFDLDRKVCDELQMDIDVLRVRMQDALLSAYDVVVLGKEAYDGVFALLSKEPEMMMMPSSPLHASEAQNAPILVVNNGDESSAHQAVSLLEETFPAEQFVPFDPLDVFERSYKFVLHLGIAHSSIPGARLNDAWAGNTPVIQLVDSIALSAQRRRRAARFASEIAEHGRTGLLVSSVDELTSVLGDVLVDSMPARAVARGAFRRTDPAAEWDTLLKAVLQ
jgi:hypothetical protein